ncbi:MAG: hypothetical protein AAGF11_19665 [Myxococcota bacterium]
MNKPLFEHEAQAGDDAIDRPHEIAALTSRPLSDNKELDQIYALLAVAERQQHLAGTQSFRAVFLCLLGAIILLLGLGLSPDKASGISILMTLALAGLAVILACVKAWQSAKRMNKHHQAAAEVAETIREVISGTDWKQTLDPLEWAHLRTRIAQLELVDLAALQ